MLVPIWPAPRTPSRLTLWAINVVVELRGEPEKETLCAHYVQTTSEIISHIKTHDHDSQWAPKPDMLARQAEMEKMMVELGGKGSKGRKGFTERRISGGGPGGGGSKRPRTTSGEVARSFEEIGLGAGGLGGAAANVRGRLVRAVLRRLGWGRED
ncbi:hypothetical protein DEU56DRAFT_761540 [Suillus clintonianus]|uniref:uncharacterized protein n=1 Tax=Suillus clintonianus TaxID=1904413 RepID=UPI001B8801A6|nr:uncharacterized protein DEU56DRAFT_761540 [Suillus clintonianus]KAG2116405.1 hypothetical protein DEU56DRAFT_761540 [Suillus clintonianus]